MRLMGRMRQVRIGTFPYQPIVDTAERVRQGLGTGSHVRAAIVIGDAMRKSMFGVVPLISLSLVLLGTGIAEATVTDGGTTYCTTNQTGVSRGYSTGTTNHAPPGGGYATYYNGSLWKVTTKAANVARGGSWAVGTNGSLNDPETYAYCINGTP
jgi:hypothetical protein